MSDDNDLVLPQYMRAPQRHSNAWVVAMDSRSVGIIKTVPNDFNQAIEQVEVDGEPSFTRNFMMLSERLTYCRAGYEAVEDPIGRPPFALTRAIQGKHSLGFTEQDATQIQQARLPAEECKMTARLAASNAEASESPVGTMKDRLDALVGKLSKKRMDAAASAELGPDLSPRTPATL